MSIHARAATVVRVFYLLTNIQEESELPNEVRGATRSEYPAIADVILRAFKEDEHNLWQYLVDNDPSLEPEGVRVSVVDGKIVACTVVLPRTIMTRAGWKPSALVTLVACDPDWQGRGHGGATIRSALDYCGAKGLALGLLYGHPGYYPRFGYVPVLPWLWTELDPAKVAASQIATAAATAAPVRLELQQGLEDPADLAEVNKLFEQSLATYPMAVRRGDDAWVWRDRNSAGKSMLLLRGANGRAVAYARTYTDTRYPGVLIAPEAAVRDAGDAVGLVAALVQRAAEKGFERLRLVLPPQEELTRAALLLGAEQNYRPPTSGMAAVTNWDMVLPERYAAAAAEGQVSGDTETWLLSYDGRPVLTAPRRQLSQMALGYLGADDVALVPGAELVGGTADWDRLRADMPALYPRWTLAPCW